MSAHVRTLLARGIKVSMLPSPPSRNRYIPEGMRHCKRCPELHKKGQHCTNRSTRKQRY